MAADPRELGGGLERTMSSLVVPWPIGWISTVDGTGHDNLAPFSSFEAVSARPPVVMVSVGDGDGRPKDTARFALETGEFVANLLTESVIESMDATSAASDGSEFDVAGIERATARTVAPPRVASVPASLECDVVGSIRFGSNTVIFGEVLHRYVDDELLTDGEVDTRMIDAVGRLGWPFYTDTEPLEFTRQC